MLLNRKDLNTLTNLTDFITWLTCHDFRKEAPDISRVAVYKNINRLEKKFPAHHIRDLRIFELVLLVAKIYNKDIVRKIHEYIATGQARKGFDFLPAKEFISSVSVLMSGKAVVSYYIPADFIEKILTEILYGHIYKEAKIGKSLPVFNCCKYGDIECNKKGYYNVLDPPQIERSHLLDFVIMSVLDNNPYSRLRDITSLSRIIESRFIESLESSDDFMFLLNKRLRYRFILKRYHLLSRNRVVGRMQIPLNAYFEHVSVYLQLPRVCASKIYGILAAYLASPRIVLTEQEVIAGAQLPTSVLKKIADELNECREVNLDVPIDGWLYPLPFEYYDPFKEEWVPEPVDVYKVFRKMGLLERRS